MTNDPLDALFYNREDVDPDEMRDPNHREPRWRCVRCKALTGAHWARYGNQHLCRACNTIFTFDKYGYVVARKKK